MKTAEACLEEFDSNADDEQGAPFFDELTMSHHHELEAEDDEEDTINNGFNEYECVEDRTLCAWPNRNDSVLNTEKVVIRIIRIDTNYL